MSEAARRSVWQHFKDDWFTWLLLVFVALVLFSIGSFLISELGRDRSIVPGKDFPAEWAVRASRSPAEAKAYREIDRSVRERQRKSFASWLEERGQFTPQDLDSIAPRLPAE